MNKQEIVKEILNNFRLTDVQADQVAEIMLRDYDFTLVDVVELVDEILSN